MFEFHLPLGTSIHNIKVEEKANFDMFFGHYSLDNKFW